MDLDRGEVKIINAPQVDDPLVRCDGWIAKRAYAAMRAEEMLGRSGAKLVEHQVVFATQNAKVFVVCGLPDSPFAPTD